MVSCGAISGATDASCASAAVLVSAGTADVEESATEVSATAVDTSDREESFPRAS